MFFVKKVCTFERYIVTYKRETGCQDHNDNKRLEVLVLRESERLDTHLEEYLTEARVLHCQTAGAFRAENVTETRVRLLRLHEVCVVNFRLARRVHWLKARHGVVGNGGVGVRHAAAVFTDWGPAWCTRRRLRQLKQPVTRFTKLLSAY